MKRMVLVVLMAGALALAGCAPSATVPEAAREGASGPVVIASLFAPFDFARQIANGTRTQVSMLMQPGVEAHTFDPTPADILRISGADLFVYIGGENEAWVEGVLEAAGGHVKALKLLDHVAALEEEIVPGMQAEEGEPGADEGQADEHIWTSPINAIAMSRAIADALIGMDPGGEKTYRANLSEYEARLTELDGEFGRAVGGGVRRELVFGDRFPFLYFAKRYGLTYSAAFPGCGSETEPSAATLKFLIDKVKSEDIPVVFTIEQGNKRVAEAVARESGARVMTLHSAHNITVAEFDAGETYLSIMQSNIGPLRAALS